MGASTVLVGTVSADTGTSYQRMIAPKARER